MGQKINPYGFRLGVTTDWKSRWFSEREYKEYLTEDWKIREAIMRRWSRRRSAASRSSAPGTRSASTSTRPAPASSSVAAAPRPTSCGRCITKITGNPKVQLNIVEIKSPELDAALIAQGVADQLANRIAFRRAMKRAVQNAQQAGALGIRVQCSGRLGGAEMSRTEWYREGRVPLHTLRADIDYGFREARTTSGRVGVKVWLYKGDILPYKSPNDDKIAREAAMAVGETSGQAAEPRRVVSSAARRQAAEAEPETPAAAQGSRSRAREAARRGRGRSPAAPTTGHETPALPWGGLNHVDAPQGRPPQAPPRPHQRHDQGRHRAGLRRVRHPGPRAGLAHRPPDRGRPYRHDPRHQARRQGLDQHLPGQAGHQEAGRDPHGLGQGQPRVLGRRRQARPGPVRALVPQRGAGPRRPDKAIQKLPIKARVITREEVF